MLSSSNATAPSHTSDSNEPVLHTPVERGVATTTTDGSSFENEVGGSGGEDEPEASGGVHDVMVAIIVAIVCVLSLILAVFIVIYIRRTKRDTREGFPEGTLDLSSPSDAASIAARWTSDPPLRRLSGGLAQRPSTTAGCSAEHTEGVPHPFKDNTFVVDDEGRPKIKSIRRTNPWPSDRGAAVDGSAETVVISVNRYESRM